MLAIDTWHDYIHFSAENLLSLDSQVVVLSLHSEGIPSHSQGIPRGRHIVSQRLPVLLSPVIPLDDNSCCLFMSFVVNYDLVVFLRFCVSALFALCL